MSPKPIFALLSLCLFAAGIIVAVIMFQQGNGVGAEGIFSVFHGLAIGGVACLVAAVLSIVSFVRGEKLALLTMPVLLCSVAVSFIAARFYGRF